MAAGESDSSESWWGGILETAKQKSAAAIQQISKDLQEFSSTIQKDTTQAVANSATSIGQNLKREDEEGDPVEDKSATGQLRDGFYNLLSNISQTLATSDTTVEGETYVVHPQDPNIFDQTKARLLAIQVNPATYCNEPDDPLDAYHAWLSAFNVEDMKGDISELLVANSQVRSIYTKLVPAAVSHGEFWSRYFFKIHQLDQDEARRTALKERAEMTSSHTFEEDLGWGDEDESWDTMPETGGGAPSGADDRLRDSTEEGAGYRDGSPPGGAGEPSRNERNPNRTDSGEVDGSTEVHRRGEREDRTDDDDDNDRDKGGEEESDGVGDNVVGSRDGSRTKDSEENVTETVTLDIGGKERVEVKEDRSPTGSSNGSSDNKGSSLGDEWEKDFDDIEITEEDIRNAQLASKDGTLNDDNDLEEWESWD